MSSNDSEHIPSCSSLEGLLADAKVNDLDDFSLGTVKHVLRLDIPMTDISIMQILDRPHKLPSNSLQLCLILDLALGQTWLVEALHDEIGAMLLEIQVESFVFDDGRMSKFLQIYEIPLQFEDVLLLDL